MRFAKQEKDHQSYFQTIYGEKLSPSFMNIHNVVYCFQE